MGTLNPLIGLTSVLLVDLQLVGNFQLRVLNAYI